MLKALYDYAVQKELALPPGYINKSIKAYILLTAQGAFLGIEQRKDEVLPCPDIGSLANGKDKCNALVEKVSVVLSNAGDAKNQFFRKTLRDGAKMEPALAICLNALENQQTFSDILAEIENRKIKSIERISFCVDGVPVVKSPAVYTWWQQYRKQFIKADEASKTLCLITGEPTIPLATVPPVNGLAVVGGHARGDALICFDKNAFCSYGLKQAANAPVSEEAFAGIKAALDDLLADAPVLAGTKFVHWYDKPIPPKADGLITFILPENLEDESEDEENDPLLLEQSSAIANKRADELVDSARTGQHAAPLSNRYHILLLSGANGRVMVRRYEQGSYEALQKNLSQWERELALCNDLGTGLIKPYKLIARLLRLLSRQKVDSQPFERAKKELAGLTPSILMAILTGATLPDAVAVRALTNIRSQMLGDEDALNAPPIPDGICCQWLKVWLLRGQRDKNREEMLMPYYNPQHPSAAYQCGALMAVYADIQRTAMPEVNAGVIQRYYASASRTPALAIAQLARLSNYHLAKIESRWLVQAYEERLNTVYTAMTGEVGKEVPTVLNLEEQAYFALGYRQMAAQIIKDKKDYQATKVNEANKTNKKEDN